MSPLDRTLSTLGRAGIAAGLLVLAFAAFELWGTGLAEARAQEELAAGFATRVAPPGPVAAPENPAGSADGAGADPIEDAAVVRGRAEGLAADDEPAIPVTAAEGDPIATLDIPAIELRKTVVEGTSRDALRTGPGHYRGTALPGRTGNAAIAGHRTTHGAPFFDIDRLEPGDEIVVETVDGRFTYIVEGHDDGHGGRVGHLIVAPDEVWVIADRGDDRLTLTACHPAYSARQRIVVTALLDGFAAGAAPTVTEAHLAVPPIAEPAAPSTSPAPAEIPSPETALAMTDTGLGWQTDQLGNTLTWVGATALIALAAAAVGRLWRRWPAYAVASPAFGLALFTCFTHLDRLLPAT